MIKQGVIAFTLFCTTAPAWSTMIFDVYGVDEARAAKIEKQYGKQIANLEEAVQKMILQDAKDEDKFSALQAEKFALLDKIQKENNVVYANWTSILYPNMKDQYITLEVVDKNDTNRVAYLKQLKKDDLIQKMLDYQTIFFELALKHSIPVDDTFCPFFHCVGGFKHPRLQPYVAIFKEGAIKDKSLVLETLKSDMNAERRGSAALLVGHFSDPNEIVDVLLPYIHDPNETVRNNAMRVIGEVLLRSKDVKQIDVKPFLILLDSPILTDRNKSLLILMAAADLPGAKEEIKAEGLTRLLNLLALKQPNNHDLAYKILLKISGKDYPENDLIAWRDWVKTQHT